MTRFAATFLTLASASSDWFRTCQSKPTLRDVQHALALEHGFSGWTELKLQADGRRRRDTRALGQFEEMAEALLEAYRTGTPAAMERHWALTWHRRNHQAMTTYVQLDLGRQAGAANQNDDITLDDARFLVAREHGFESWDALVTYYTSLPVQSSLITTKPIRLVTAETVSDESPAWHSRDWSAVVARLKEANASGIDAEGQMTDAMLEDVSRIEHITALKLNGSRSVTDAGVRHLSRLPRLRHLDLSGTGITDRGLEVLRSLPELETVSLAWTKVTDAGVAHLSGCERLGDVNLQGTSIGRRCAPCTRGEGVPLSTEDRQRRHRRRSRAAPRDSDLQELAWRRANNGSSEL